jgi:hypothetical protein
MGVIKFVVLLIISVVSLYFIITSIQNLLVAQERVKEAQKDLREATNEFEYYSKEAKKSAEFYSSYGCTYKGNYIWSCPAGTPTYPAKKYVPTTKV